jgi:hypothetical protein
MAYFPPIPVEEVKGQSVGCPACGWKGKGAECRPKPDEVVKCPKCGRPVIRIDQPCRCRKTE